MATTDLPPDNPPIGILDAPFDSALSDRYLVYALSTITARSLPDVRDGLKPVHRRLLWAMRLLRLDPAQGYKKSARVVGDVIGKYHPHGDQSVYDAMVRLAQPYMMRYPLVDGQGNFGNIDGDNAAAYRYTEARLTQVAIDLMDGLDEDAVDYRPTYNGEDHEPELFPGAFPNLLANGAAGIAVGMATSIPPHNVAELYEAAILLVDQPEADDAAVGALVRGPDFPTGGLVVDSAAAIAETYRTGRGGFRVRARWHVEDLGRGTWNAIVTEIPYGVQKGKLIEQIATIINDKKLPILADIRDESDSEIRVVIEPRSRSVDPQLLMESLFRLSDLESRFSLNLNVLDKTRTPRVMSLRETLLAWVEHQFVILRRKSEHRLAKIADRLELLDGYLIAYLNLDRVIEIIRTEDEPKPVMIAEFGLTDRQAEAILDMRLRRLRKLEEMEIRKERDGLESERNGLEALLGSEARQRTRLKRDFGKLRDRYGPEATLGKRRTSIEEAAPARDIPLEAMIEREPVTILLSQRGWIRAIKGHLDAAGIAAAKFKEGDAALFSLTAQTTDKILLAADNGRFFTLGADRLPGGRGFGEPVRLMIDLDGAVEIVGLFRASMAEKLLVAASDGRGFIVPVAETLAETRKGKTVVTPRAGAKLKVVRPVDPTADQVAVIGENRRLLVFALAELPEMARGQGVQFQRYNDGGLSDAITFVLAQGLSWTMGGESGRTRTEADLTFWRSARGAAGRMPPNGFPRDNRF
ncbi:DNA topoisomerase IV subunit A [Sphingomonas panacis]|uniref:DNA topoisomerase 4 subunit A n=1 Tax=Sphingomonas panacis TaxID=1560345 RepID=A0A1B3ZF32_9SPHN|nr:DNA topoisomerase IV subunit A [Sphingomonas panacis]AOH86049.1 DNA topoisomerase IV subunit A [Sphingomonas panacis]